MAQPISIHAAKPGDILASEVITASGNIVLPSGVTLTRDILDHLKRFGVYTLIIRK
ncbi:hypothetical protein ACFOQM_05495 [Paenibacillus sp. GCM10012307]|uniref:Uncharacterized protein n=1 Tax=Paenibacillus roseus TaxID=2798579 RepID=A0A934MK86_9BACL|nr:hypothetical protein [Paenibacillus roseus]MBJ6360760.1 hypothetical protein [Paenibacillus roseus]